MASSGKTIRGGIRDFLEKGSRNVGRSGAGSGGVFQMASYAAVLRTTPDLIEFVVRPSHDWKSYQLRCAQQRPAH